MDRLSPLGFFTGYRTGIPVIAMVCLLIAAAIARPARGAGVPAGDDRPAASETDGRADDPAAGTPPDARPPTVHPQTGAQPPPSAPGARSRLPLSFEENRGQLDGRVRFIARHGGGTFFFTRDGMTAVFTRRVDAVGDTAAGAAPVEPKAPAPVPTENFALKVFFEGTAEGVTVEGMDRMPGKVSYFKGKDPDKWISGAPTYERVVYRGIYPGIDLFYRGAGGSLKHEFVVAPGADTGRIRMRYEGQDKLRLDDSGRLVIATPWGELIEEAPTAHQIIGGERIPVEIRYRLDAEKGRLEFAPCKDRRPDHPLVIDPGLSGPITAR